MVRRMTPSQFRSYARQQQNKMNQQLRRLNQEVDRVNRANKAAIKKAVRDHNREVDRVNNQNRRALNSYNQEVRRVNRHNKAAVSKYNQAVRSHNARVESQRRQRIRVLKSSSSVSYAPVRESSINLNARYDSLPNSGDQSPYGDLVALSEREAANSAEVAEALVSDELSEPEQIEDTGLIEYLAEFSEDMCDRWRGALYSLSPSNPDAARHFCTSAREIFTEILAHWAPDEEVLAADPTCELTPNKTGPSRRSKIRFFLAKKGADTPEMLGFVNQDIEDVLQLFHVFNEATHGVAGKHGFRKLQAIKKRVEGSIMFLASVAV